MYLLFEQGYQQGIRIIVKPCVGVNKLRFEMHIIQQNDDKAGDVVLQSSKNPTEAYKECSRQREGLLKDVH